MPVAQIQFLAAPFPIQPPTENWVLLSCNMDLRRSCWKNYRWGPIPIYARTHGNKVSNFIYTSQMTADFSLTKDEQGKHRTKISAAKQKKKKSKCQRETNSHQHKM